MNFRPIASDIAGLLLTCILTAHSAEPPKIVKLGPNGPGLERVVIDADFPGAYQVEIADVNGDGKRDIVALGGGTVAWYENPVWTKRIVSDAKTTPGVISSATRDIDGDGKAEIAIAYEFEMNVPTKGKLLIARQGENGWKYDKFGDFPSIHRLRWGDFDGDGKADLAVAPIFGPSATSPNFQQEGAGLLVLFAANGFRPDEFARKKVTHAIGVVPWAGKGRDTILTASNEGVWRHRNVDGSWVSWKLFDGAAGNRPKTGASEIHQGRFSDGSAFFATIEPWHGTTVVVHTESPTGSDRFEKESLLDDALNDGHALCVADIDGDGTDEVFAGYRGKGTSVIGYRYEGGAWNRTVVDPAIAAQDLRSADMDGDGHHDVVAVGGSSKNVIMYRSVVP